MTDFGSSWSCVSDLTMPSVRVSGNRVVAEAIARRLQTPRGRLLDDPNYGYALSDMVESDLTAADMALVQTAVRAECVKDQRVRSAEAKVTLAGGVLIATITLTTADGPFTLVLSVSSVTTQLLAVSP